MARFCRIPAVPHVAVIAKVAFTSKDRVRDVIRNFNADGFGSLYPKYRGGQAPKSSPAAPGVRQLSFTAANYRSQSQYAVAVMRHHRGATASTRAMNATAAASAPGPVNR